MLKLLVPDPLALVLLLHHPLFIQMMMTTMMMMKMMMMMINKRKKKNKRRRRMMMMMILRPLLLHLLLAFSLDPPEPNAPNLLLNQSLPQAHSKPEREAVKLRFSTPNNPTINNQSIQDTEQEQERNQER